MHLMRILVTEGDEIGAASKGRCMYQVLALELLIYLNCSITLTVLRLPVWSSVLTMFSRGVILNWVWSAVRISIWTQALSMVSLKERTITLRRMLPSSIPNYPEIHEALSPIDPISTPRKDRAGHCMSGYSVATLYKSRPHESQGNDIRKNHDLWISDG